MGTDEEQGAVREELRLVEEELAGLRQAVMQLREQIAERSDAPGDEADTATALTMAEEQEALIAQLEARRDQLRRRLGAD